MSAKGGSGNAAALLVVAAVVWKREADEDIEFFYSLRASVPPARTWWIRKV
jgi:hypothetical protein